MLTDFYFEVENFEERLQSCSKCMSALSGINHIPRLRLHDLGTDILTAIDHHIAAHINATMWIVDQAHQINKRHRPNADDFELRMAYFSKEKRLTEEEQAKIEGQLERERLALELQMRRSRSKASELQEASIRELKVSYKTFFFLVRAFQDAGYASLLSLAGQPAGVHSSMNSAVSRSQNPAHEVIAAIEGYSDWFSSFRDKRNRVKEGVNFSLRGPEWDVGIGFTFATKDGGIVSNLSEENCFRLADLINAIAFSRKLLEAIENEALSKDLESGAC